MTLTSPNIESVILNRRTVHNFIPGKLPPEETIIRALELAVCAPNHYATEPWRFYLLGEEARQKICVLNSELMRAARGDKAAEIKLRRWGEIPGWLLMTCVQSPDQVRYMEDYAACCCAAQNMMLYLWSLGIGVKWTTGDVTRNPEFHEITGTDPESESVVGLFWYGYPAETPSTPRKGTEDKIVRLA